MTLRMKSSRDSNELSAIQVECVDEARPPSFARVCQAQSNLLATLIESPGFHWSHLPQNGNPETGFDVMILLYVALCNLC